MQRMTHSLIAVALTLLFSHGISVAETEKPPKLPVSLGAWTGPHASTYKGALRRGMGKEVVFVKPKAAKAVIEGEVEEKGKGVVVHLVIKAGSTGEVVERRDFPLGKSPSTGQANKMGKAVVAMARRAE